MTALRGAQSAEVPLVGRDAEAALLEAAAAEAMRGRGSLLLLAGEAGIGKTSLANAAAERSKAIVLRGAASRDTTPPHGPMISAMRARLRSDPKAFSDCGTMLPHLALLMPEVGHPPQRSDQATIFEAIRCALESVSRVDTTILILDDLQWSDDATLDLLAYLAAPLQQLSVLLIGIYRTDELDRGHSLRRLRTEVRRAGGGEIDLSPLSVDQTCAVAAEILGAPVAGSLGRAIHERTQGVPFFVEEVTHALVASDRVQAGRQGFELSGGDHVPVPETVRDAVLMRASSLSSTGRAAAEVAAVAEEDFELEHVATLASKDGLSELIECGLVVESEDGLGEFRHALVREAIYADVAWLRRSELHRSLAERLTTAQAPSFGIARHWLGAREETLARQSLVAAVEEFCAVHAYRDAAGAGRRALELWGSGDDVAERLQLLERYAGCAELAGDRAEAARAWREVAEIRNSEGAHAASAVAQRRLAGIYALDGDNARTIDSRRLAADAFARAGALDEAATDHLVAAGLMQRAGEHSGAVEIARLAIAEAERIGRFDLQAEALGIEGVAMAKRGDVDSGMSLVQSGLSLALKQGITARVASLYWCLGTVLEAGADYGPARDALETAIGLCRTAQATEQEHTCIECMTYLLRELGEWSRSVELCKQMSGEDTPAEARLVVDGMRGAIEGFRGNLDLARRLLSGVHEAAIRLDVLSMQVDLSAALAYVASEQGDNETAASHCRFLLQRWEISEDHHYAVWGLRWAASFFAQSGDGQQARACAEALGRIAAEGGSTATLAALAHALAEAALLDGEVEVAAEQIGRAVVLHRSLDIPWERAHISLRAGVILAAAGERGLALERLTDAFRIARKLGARPLMAAVSAEVAALGESVDRRLGKRAAAAHEGSGLTRRELEVMRLVAGGGTNREIAADLFVSPRTIDMHVRNIFSKLGCRSRVEAAARARELGLLNGARP
jgi:DNA-binding CsgD family transcriptional regulator